MRPKTARAAHLLASAAVAAVLALCRWPAARPPATTSPARSAARRAAHRRRLAALSSTSGASATAPIPTTPMRRSATPRRCAPPASAPRPSPCSSRPRSAIRTTCRCSAPMAARWPTPATISRRSMCSSRAHTPDQPDWRILNAQGAVLDQMGRHAEAQRHYSTALKIVPDEPSMLSNLGLSYALTKDLQARRGDAAARGGAAQCRAEGAAEPRSGGRPAGPLRRGREDRQRRSAARTKPPPMSPICGRCWRSRATVKKPARSPTCRRPTPAPDRSAIQAR